MSDNPYEIMMPSGPFEKAMDKAVAEENERFLADPKAQRRAEEAGDRWRHIMDAEDAAGPHAVVLPVAVAQGLLAMLNGETPRMEELVPGLHKSSLAEAIAKAEDRQPAPVRYPEATIRRQESNRLAHNWVAAHGFDKDNVAAWIKGNEDSQQPNKFSEQYSQDLGFDSQADMRGE